MSSQRKTAIVTGASQGIGAGVVKAFVERGFNVVANSRKVTQSTEVAASDHVARVGKKKGSGVFLGWPNHLARPPLRPQRRLQTQLLRRPLLPSRRPVRRAAYQG